MLNNEFPPLGGGTGTVNNEIFNQLKSNPNIIIDLITSAIHNNAEKTEFADRINIYKVPVNNKNIHHSSNLELIKYTLKAFWLARKLNKINKYDIVFAWSSIPAGFVALLMFLCYNLKYIVRVGGPDIPNFEERYKYLYKIITPIIKIIWRKASCLIAKCKTEKEMILNILPKLNVNIIHNGVDTAKFHPKQETLTIENPLKIICPARLIKRKGQEILIKAIHKLKSENINFQVFMIGDGDEKQNYIHLTEQLNLTENIFFLSYISRQEIIKYYQLAQIFVLPSYNEGMSNALLEAMASANVPIVTNVGGTEELVNKDNGFIFNTGNYIELYEILKQISLNTEQLIGLSRNALRTAQQFTWTRIVQQYIEILNSYIKTN